MGVCPIWLKIESWFTFPVGKPNVLSECLFEVEALISNRGDL